MCAVDLTRSIASKSASVKAAAAKKLAFSVENILDPTKFCSRQEQQQFNARHWPQGFGGDGDERLDDDHSDCQSSKFKQKVRLKKNKSPAKFFVFQPATLCVQKSLNLSN